MAQTAKQSMMGRVVLGRYRIVAPLARGGMGIIYLGRLEGSAGFAKPVVIKTVIPEGNESERTVQLFVREARILSNLEHPSIVGVLDFGEAGADYVMVLEYVHGFHLGAWSRFVHQTRTNMPIEHAVETMLPVLDALDFAHSLKRPDGAPLGIVHRDISPANILIDNQGHVKLHDFGIARMADDEFKTQDGSFRGTLSYTAPETMQGVAASPRSDLYGCGVVLYQLISGVNPFKRDLPSETLHRVLTHVPPGLTSLRGEVSQKLEQVVARAMAKDPAERFESAAELAAALREARTWAEASAVQDLVRTVQSDFNGSEMAQHLGVEPLAMRDSAWRAETGERASLSSSPPPRSAPGSFDQTVVARTVAADPEFATVQAMPSSALLELARGATEESAPATAEPQRSALPEQRAAAGTRRRPALMLAGAGLMLLLGGAVAFAVFGGTREPAAPHFLLIEKQSAPASSNDAARTAPTTLASDSAAPAVPGAASSAAPLASSGAARAGGSAPGSTSLSGAFQRQQGRIVSCFRAHGSESSDQPQLTVRFKIDGLGNVQSAELSPAGLSSSALGSCILGVARATRFPATGADVNFAIPITAVRK